MPSTAISLKGVGVKKDADKAFERLIGAAEDEDSDAKRYLIEHFG